MAIGDDFAISGAGAITHVSGTTNYTVLALHRWLQDLADDAALTGDDFLDITTGTPSERSTDNIITLNSPFNIDDTAAEFLYDGSISQLGGDTVYAGLVVVGAVETGTELQIWQDEAILTSHWSTGKNIDAAANILNRVLVKVRDNGADIDGKKIIVWARELSDTYAEFALTMALGNNVAAIFTANDLNNQTAAATIATWTEITNTEGYQLLDIAADGSATEPYYSQWDYGIRTASNVYERTKWLARRGSAEAIHSTTGPLFRGITHEFAYDTETITMVEDSVLAWGTSFAYDTGTGTVPAVGQYWENSTVGGVGKVVWVSAGAAATGSVVIQRETTTATWVTTNVFALLGGTGAFNINGAVTGGTNAGGSGRLLALNDAGTSGTCWVQLLSGAAPATTYLLFERGANTAKSANVNGAATARTVKPEFLGVYTGSSIIGAFGIGVAPSDGIAADLFTTLTGGSVNPPNNQLFTVSGLVSGDRVLVTNDDTGIDFNQFTTTATYNGLGVTTISVTPAIPADTPQVTTIRIQLDSGVYRAIATISWTGSDFTIASTDFTDPLDATTGNNLFIGYIDKATASTSEQITMKFSAPRTMFIRVRDGGATPIKTFESTAVFGAGGGSATANRIADA
jgi:hypothetical protein